jgi:hypothetical protein
LMMSRAILWNDNCHLLIFLNVFILILIYIKFL